MSSRSISSVTLAWVSAVLLAGCPSDPVASPDAAVVPDAFVAAEPDAFVEACGATPTCQDEQIAGLDFFDTVTPALITEEGTTTGEFLTHIDATGGGFTPSQSYVDARFTETGLEKVEISDEDSLLSSDWDIAFRRFIVRLNSGVSGPSCVVAARTAPGTSFDELSEPPTDGYRVESYFTETCDVVPDGSGLGSPATALSSYWTYPGCVTMTGNVYVVRTAARRHVKLEVISYYPEAIQEQCQTTMSVPMPSMAGNFRVRWAFLD